MLLTILGIILLVGGIVGAIVYENTIYDYNWVPCVCIPALVIGAILTVTCSIIIIDTQVNADISYQNMVAEKAAIEYRLEQIDTNDQNVLINGGVYNDILDYNKHLRTIKKWAKNPWFNWFYVNKIAELDYIEFPESVE